MVATSGENLMAKKKVGKRKLTKADHYYINEHLSLLNDVQIAESVGCSVTTVRKIRFIKDHPESCAAQDAETKAHAIAAKQTEEVNPFPAGVEASPLARPDNGYLKPYSKKGATVMYQEAAMVGDIGHGTDSGTRHLVEVKKKYDPTRIHKIRPE